MTYWAIGAELERAGQLNERGRPFHHKSVRAMLDDEKGSGALPARSCRDQGVNGRDTGKRSYESSRMPNPFLPSTW
jgi:hypothetical protein